MQIKFLPEQNFELLSEISIRKNFSSISFFSKVQRVRIRRRNTTLDASFISKLKNIFEELSFYFPFLQFAIHPPLERTRWKQKLENSWSASAKFRSRTASSHLLTRCCAHCVESRAGKVFFSSQPSKNSLPRSRVVEKFCLITYTRFLSPPFSTFSPPNFASPTGKLVNKKIWSRCVTVS